MSDVPTHILLVEDNPDDARLLRDLLAEADHGRFRLTHVDRLAAGIACVQKGGIALMLLDLSLPDSLALETLNHVHAEATGIPIVVLTGVEDEVLGLQLIQRGAQDYLVKSQVTGPLLRRSLHYAIERARMANELRDKTTLLQSVLDSVADGVVMADETGAFKVWNPAASRIVGSGPAPLQIDEWTSHYNLFLSDKATPYPPRALPLAKAIQGESVNDELIYIRNSQKIHEAWLSVSARPLRDDTGRIKGGVAVFRDITERRRTEEALRNTQEQYRLLVTRANDIIYRTDPMGRFTFVNPVAMRIMKYTEQELLGHRFVELIHPDHRDAAERFYGHQFVRRRPSTYYEFIALAKDGTEVWIGQNVQVLQEAGKVIGFQAVARDITERKRAEEARLESEERLRSIMQSTDNAIIVMDTEGLTIFWNRGAEKCFGYAAEEMVGQPVTRIVPERFREAHQRGIQRVAEAGRLTVQRSMFELIGLRKDASEFPIEFSLATWSAQSKLFITAVIRDITERRSAEAAVRESEARYRRLIESLPAAVYTCDREGRVTLYNQAAISLWGQEPERGKDLWCGPWKIYRPDGTPLPIDHCPMAVAMREGRMIRGVEIVIERPDGTKRNILPHPDPICDASGTVVGFVDMLMDITERKQAEEERQKLARDRLLLLDSTGDGIYGLDLEGRCSFINKAGAKMLGYQPDELMGRDMHEAVHHSFPDGTPYPREQCRIYEAFTTRQSRHVDREVFWRKDGSSFPTAYSSYPVFEQDILTGAVVTFVDITERKRLEEERSHRAARLVGQQSALTALTQSRLFQSSELKPTLQHITAIAARTLDIERVGIWRFDRNRSLLQCIDLFELSHGRHTAGVTLSVESFPLYFEALAASQIIAADDVHTDERTRELSNSFLSPACINSMMDVPIYLFGRLEGVICHEHVGPARHWTEDEQMFAVAMSNLVTLAYEQGERRRAEEQLQHSQEQLRNLTGRLESIQEEERIRISREVHDKLGQDLTGVKLELAFLRDQLAEAGPAVLARIEALTKQVDGTMQSVRRIATELRPVVLDQLGLIAAIEWQAGEFQARTGITCTLNLYLRAVSLSITHSTGVFRIFQEILTNVARHAGASRVDISMQEHRGHLVLRVTDNGRGITDDQLSGSKSLGLLGMRERALLLGGETLIERNPDKGTTVKVRIPMDPPQPDPRDGDGDAPEFV
ncbi:MAG TPA: PAS domain S-box protein [Nitrospiraceae bacterium]|nr:PAS domain S-box protein [Nitrospiraceae bacterium]